MAQPRPAGLPFLLGRQRGRSLLLRGRSPPSHAGALPSRSHAGGPSSHAGGPSSHAGGPSSHAGGPPTSYAGTIWASDDGGGTVFARTGDHPGRPGVRDPGRAGRGHRRPCQPGPRPPTGRLGDADPLLYAGLLGPGYPLGAVTPFAGVRALGPATTCRAAGGEITETDHGRLSTPDPGDPGAAAQVAEALVQAVTPLRDAPGPVELSLTGGKDSRLIAAALARAGVAVHARTYGFPDHPDVVIAAQVARELGLEHEIAEPRTTGGGPGGADGAAAGRSTGPATVQEVDVLGRLRATVLVADGMLSAFENVGRPDPDAATAAIAIGGHGGELLRGGYAKIIPGSAARRAAGSAELLRRLTMRRVPLLRARWRAGYVASVAPWAAAVAAHPQAALDDFYLVNRAGRWSAAARQAYAIRSVHGAAVLRRPGGPRGPFRAAGRTPRRPPGARCDRRAVPGAARHPARRRPLEVRRRPWPRSPLVPASAPASAAGRWRPGPLRLAARVRRRGGRLPAGLRARYRNRGRPVRASSAGPRPSGCSGRRTPIRSPSGRWPPWPR